MRKGKEDPVVLAVRRETLPGLRLVYALYRTKLKNGAGYAYSVTVSVTGTYGSETAAVSDLTRSGEEAERLFRLLADETVTPCALGDVLEEIL